MATKAKRTKTTLHTRLMSIAHAEVTRHIVTYDGEKCFNICTYLQALESKLDGLFCGGELPLGDFELNAHSVARYLWACLTLLEGEQPYATTFRGMPTLD
jgi:hypothetical protein